MAWGRVSAAAENRPHDPRRNQPGLHNQLDYIAVPKRDPEGAVAVEGVTKFYEKFYQCEEEGARTEWIGEARELLEPVTEEEVASVAAALRNRRAVGPDKLVSELLKYGGAKLHRLLADLINQIFREHSSIVELKAGILFPLNKLKGDKIAANTRPVIFLVASQDLVDHRSPKNRSSSGSFFLYLSACIPKG